MIGNPTITIGQDNAEGSAEAEHEEQQAGRFYDGIDGCCKKLRKDSGTIKVLGRLSGRGPKLVDDGVRTLTTNETSRDAKVYQLFLHDIFRHSGSGLVVLCAASLGKQWVVHLAEDDRIGLVSFIKDNKTNLHCTVLELLAEEYQVPSVNGLHNPFVLSIWRLTRSRS